MAGSYVYLFFYFVTINTCLGPWYIILPGFAPPGRLELGTLAQRLLRDYPLSHSSVLSQGQIQRLLRMKRKRAQRAALGGKKVLIESSVIGLMANLGSK